MKLSVPKTQTRNRTSKEIENGAKSLTLWKKTGGGLLLFKFASNNDHPVSVNKFKTMFECAGVPLEKRGQILHYVDFAR